MSHVRQKIRDEIILAATGLVTTGINVSSSRVFSYEDDQLPRLNIYTGNEEISIDEENRIARVQNRTLEIIVKGRCKLPTSGDNSAVSDLLDTIAAEVEAAVLGANYIVITGIDLENIEVEEDQAEQTVGEITLTFSVPYLTRDGQPEITF